MKYHAMMMMMVISAQIHLFYSPIAVISRCNDQCDDYRISQCMPIVQRPIINLFSINRQTMKFVTRTDPEPRLELSTRHYYKIAIRPHSLARVFDQDGAIKSD
jgi:hypothetical protein